MVVIQLLLQMYIALFTEDLWKDDKVGYAGA